MTTRRSFVRFMRSTRTGSLRRLRPGLNGAMSLRTRARSAETLLQRQVSHRGSRLNRRLITGLQIHGTDLTAARGQRRQQSLFSITLTRVISLTTAVFSSLRRLNSRIIRTLTELRMRLQAHLWQAIILIRMVRRAHMLLPSLKQGKITELTLITLPQGLSRNRGYLAVARALQAMCQDLKTCLITLISVLLPQTAIRQQLTDSTTQQVLMRIT